MRVHNRRTRLKRTNYTATSTCIASVLQKRADDDAHAPLAAASDRQRGFLMAVVSQNAVYMPYSLLLSIAFNTQKAEQWRMRRYR